MQHIDRRANSISFWWPFRTANFEKMWFTVN